MGTHRVALVAIILAACGDDGGSTQVDAGADGSSGDGGGGENIPCDYTEMMDATNATVPTAESSGLTLSTSRIAICGKLDTGHYDAANELVDADGILFTVAAQTNVIVHLVGSGIATPDTTVVQILKQNANQLFGYGVVEGDHATLIFDLPAGEYVAAVYALNGAALGTAIDYKVLISADTARCPTKTGTADHTEGADGGANDVIDYNFASNSQSTLSASTTDAPEMTNLTIAAGSSYLITGAAENVDPSDDYMDRDTYAFTTGPTTNQMSIRLNWASTAVDFDYRVYPVPTGNPESFVAGVDISDTEDEYETFAVKPNTTYWLWVAAEDGSTLPADYSATLCGETFAP